MLAKQLAYALKPISGGHLPSQAVPQEAGEEADEPSVPTEEHVWWNQARLYGHRVPPTPKTSDL